MLLDIPFESAVRSKFALKAKFLQLSNIFLMSMKEDRNTNSHRNVLSAEPKRISSSKNHTIAIRYFPLFLRQSKMTLSTPTVFSLSSMNLMLQTLPALVATESLC